MRRGLALSVALFLGCSSSEAPMATAPPTIVFDWERNGSRDIYRATLDGTDTVRLTSAPDDEHPTARGRTVVFTSYRDGNGELYSVPATGGTAVRLTHTSENETQPALSPDGTRIAYVSDVSGVTKLWTCASDGSGAQALTVGFGFAGAVEASPSWSPDGQRLAFVTTTNGSADIYVLTVGGGAPAALVTAQSADVEPAWSPDGTQVAFASNRSPGGSTNVYVVNVATRAITGLTTGPGPDGQPGWLPDGRIVYTTWAAGTPRLRWLDPLAPSSAGDVPLPAGDAEHAAAVY